MALEIPSKPSNVPAEDMDGFDGIASAIEDHVGRIEIDKNVGAMQVVEKLKQLRCALLAGLKHQIEVLISEELSDFIEARDHHLVFGVATGRDEAHVRADALNPLR